MHIFLYQYRWALENPFEESQLERMEGSSGERWILVKPGLNVVSVEANRTGGIRVDSTDIPSEQYDSNV